MSKNSKRSVYLISKELEDIKEKWLKKEISIEQLTHELIKYNNMETDLQSKKEVICVIGNKLLLDANVETSHEKITNISLAFVPIMISYIAFFVSIFEQDKLSTSMYAGIVILLTIGLGCIVFPAMNKHKGKYCREKTFYQVVIEIFDDEIIS